MAVETCEGCGGCCMYFDAPQGFGPYFWAELDGTPLTPKMLESADYERYKALPTPLREELLAYWREEHEDEYRPCFWLDMETRRCKHHEWRPNVCREFKVGSPGCVTFHEIHFVKAAPEL